MKIGSIELNRGALSSIGVIIIGIVIAAIILATDRSTGGDEHGASEAAPEYERGPHGGRLLRDGDFAIEATIYETGVPPVFRVYAYVKDKPIDPSSVQLTAEVYRIGPVVDRMGFQKELDYLLGDSVVYEPHSFEAKFRARYNGREHLLAFSQIEGRTQLSPSALKASGIVMDTARPRTMRSTLELPGEIVSNADRVAHVVPRLGGVVTEVRKSVGDRVSRGEVIAVVQSRELADLAAEHAAATKRVALARSTANREEQLFKKKIGSEQEYEEARQKLAEAQIEQQTASQKLSALGVSARGVSTRYEIRAPFNGTVVERRIAVGEAVRDDSDIFLIADLSTVWVELTVSPNDVRTIRIGQTVTINSDAIGETATGTVEYVSPLVASETRSGKARVQLANPKGVWRPGVSVRVQLVQEEHDVALAVKTVALQKFREWDVVFVRQGELFEIMPVELGRKDGEWIEVTSGLKPGTPYVAENSFILKADVEKSGATHDH